MAAPLDRQALYRVARELEKSDSPDQREAARALHMLLALQFHGEDLEALYREHQSASTRNMLRASGALLARRGKRSGHEAARARVLAAKSDDERAALMIDFLRESEPTMSLRLAAKCVSHVLGGDADTIRSNYLRRKRR